MAAHITAAAPGGPRYDPSLSRAQRREAKNGVWLCQACAKVIDDDPISHTVKLLQGWKAGAEDRAASELARSSEYRSLVASEFLDGLETWERVAVMALEEELGCTIKTGVRIRTTSGGMLFDGVAVRGEQLVAIQIYDCHDRGFAFWRIPHLTDLLEKVTFDRFPSIVLFVVVVSTASPEKDAAARIDVSEALAKAPFETEFRMFRLHDLRARFNV